MKNKTKVVIICLLIVVIAVIGVLVIPRINSTSTSSNDTISTEPSLSKDNLVNTTYKSKEGATLSFTIDGESLIANVEYTKDTDIEDYNKANFKWVQSIDIVSNKLLFTDSYHTIVYDEGKDNENDMFVYQLKSGFFTVNEDDSITWDGCPEADYRALIFIKK